MVVRHLSEVRRRGALNIELIVALAILMIGMVPIVAGFLSEIKLARRYYQDAAAMELLDGETEILAAGNWKSYPEGEHMLRVTGPTVSNLPPGKFVLIRKANVCRVEWRPAKHGRAMAREVRVQ